MENKRASKTAKVEFLCRHTIKNLPDSSSLRRQLLDGVVAALPAVNETRSEAATLLHHMSEFDDAQSRLALDFDAKLTFGKDGK